MYFGGSQGFSAIFKPRVTRLGRFFKPRGFEKKIIYHLRFGGEFGGGFWLREFGVGGLVFAKVWCEVLVGQV